MPASGTLKMVSFVGVFQMLPSHHDPSQEFMTSYLSRRFRDHGVNVISDANIWSRLLDMAAAKESGTRMFREVRSSLDWHHCAESANNPVAR